jgi:tetratricopeptide (TPR) repeat protein
MVMAGLGHRGFLAAALLGSALLALRSVSAQPVLDRALAGAQLANHEGCAILKVDFNVRIRYASHFPLERGNELRIAVNLIDRNQAAVLALLTSRREAVTLPDGERAGIKAIDLETQNLTEAVLRIVFDRALAYQVAPTSDAQSIVVAIAGANRSATCQPIFPAVASRTSATGDTRGADADTGAAVRPKDRPPGTISDSDLRSAAAWMDEGRAALKHNNVGGAIQLFAKVLKYPQNQYSAEAQELLGLAHQRGGQLSQARADYEDYLRRYPSGEQSERVRQRLAGIVTAVGDPSAPPRAPNGLPGGMLPIGKFAQTRATNWAFVASVSSFYIRDDSFRTVKDASVAPNPNADPDDHAVHQNEMLSTLDLMGTWNNDQTKGRIRFSGGEEHRFDAPNQTDETGISALSIETRVKDWNLSMVAGRQTLNADGMLGRFDGMLFSWQPLPMLKVDLVGGAPASSRYDVPFKNERYFYGAGIGLGPFFGGFETTLYAIEQRDRWLVDRQAIGADFRYIDPSKFAFGNVDYDIHFQRLNAAIFSGSWTLFDKSTIYGGADYRRTPYLSTWNALINQPFATLYDILKSQTETSQQLQQIAIDQTPIYKSAMLGFSHPLSDKLQVAADATIVNLTQPIAQTWPNSPLLATLPAGSEYYYSVQLIGANIFKDGDMYIGALRYAQLPGSKQYVLDLNTRYPLTNDWLLSPRLRLGYEIDNGTGLKQYTLLPSFLVDYQLTRDLNFEFEVGAEWTSAVQPRIRTSDIELLVTIGLRYSFYVDGSASANAADDKGKPATPAAAAMCRYSTRLDGRCASPKLAIP